MGSEGYVYTTTDGKEMEIYFIWDKAGRHYYSNVEVRIGDSWHALNIKESTKFWNDMKKAVINQFMEDIYF